MTDDGLGGMSPGATVAVGFVCVVIGGVMSGTYSLPMRFVRSWKWENIWLIYCSFGGMLFPLIFCAATAPAGLEDYLTASSVLPVIGFGILWGLASVLFGLALPLVGQSLTFGIVLSMSSAVGSLLPMLIFHTSKSFTPSGLLVWAGLVVAVVGVVVLSVAGSRKEKEQSSRNQVKSAEPDDGSLSSSSSSSSSDSDDKKKDSDDDGTGMDDIPIVDVEPESPSSTSSSQHGATLADEDSDKGKLDSNSRGSSKVGLVERTESSSEHNDAPPKEQKPAEKGCCGLSRAARGIICCIVSGLLSPMLNLGFTFGDSIRVGAEKLGASPLVSSSTVWILAIGAGFTFNGGYPIYLLFKNHTWALFKNISLRDACFNCMLMVVMGVLWFGGTIVYGMGATLIGALGATIGWPVYMALMVLSSNIGAIIQGEWRNTSARARCMLAIGLIILLVSIVFFALSSVLDTDDLSSSVSSSLSSLSSSWFA